MSESANTTILGANRSDSHDRLSSLVQPHGVLLVISSQLKILQASNNTQEYLGISPQNLLELPIGSLFAPEQITALQQCLQERENCISFLKLSIFSSQNELYFDALVHQTAQAIILELEPTNSQAELSFLSFHNRLKGAISKMRFRSNLAELFAVAIEEIQKLIDFDRVMVYQFDSQGAGEVIAEARREDLSSYLGLHYPATDIPDPVREFYKRTSSRFIPNLTARSVELFPQNISLDLTFSVLRGVDPCCVQYHQNMDVAAMFVLPLVVEQNLWGLISCHHHIPKYLSYEIRSACEFLGQFVALELAKLIDREEANYKIDLKSLSSDLVESISQTDNIREALIVPERNLLDLVSASGAAICLDEEITLVGNTPSIEEIRPLIEWADPQVTDSLFYTNCLPKLYPAAEAVKNVASGLLLLRISQVRRYYILWFRPEVIQTIDWAGNPNESSVVEADNSVTLGPRQSFVRWQEIVRSTSLPWQKCELDIVLDVKNAIVGIVLSKAEELAKLNRELERSNQDLASFAFAASHDLKEPLRGIYNYSTILLEDYAHLFDDEGMDYLQTLLHLSVRMETLIDTLLKLSLLGQAQLNLQLTDLNESIDRIIEIFYASHPESQFQIRLPRPLPTVWCDPVLVNEVFSNLIGNAFKYNDRLEPWVEIGYSDASERSEQKSLASFLFYVKDNGIGIQAHHRETIFKLFKRLHSQEKYGGGTGAGLAIVKKIIERHGGKIWVESTYGQEATFYFTLE
jgi:light-regulated signal transduction histidine kinase (bacteriophytochrome)